MNLYEYLRAPTGVYFAKNKYLSFAIKNGNKAVNTHTQIRDPEFTTTNYGRNLKKSKHLYSLSQIVWMI